MSCVGVGQYLSVKVSAGLRELESFRDGDREVGEEDLLVFGGCELGLRATEERLHLHATDTACIAVAENEASHVDDALSVDPELKLAIRLSNVVETNALADSCPGPCCKLEGTAADGLAIGGVAVGVGEAADLLVRGELAPIGGREVGVEFAVSVCTPHDAGREACTGSATA